jgi:hypothetical protein
MALGYDQTEYNPYSNDELMQLEGLLGGQGLGAPPAQPPATSPIMPEPLATPSAVPVAPVTPSEPAPITPMAPPSAAAPVLPAAPEPLDVSSPTQKTMAPRGLERSGYTVEGVSDPERDKLMALHQQMAGERMASIDDMAKTEGGILQGRMKRADTKVGAANVEANKAQMALAGQQAARQKLEQEGAEWSKLKETPAKAFEGQEWAGVLAAIGIGAGTFAQAMGWQRGNPVLEQFDSIVNRSIAAQREQKNSRLAEIRDRIGDHKAAEQLLSAQLHDAIADRAAAEQQRADSQEAFDRLGSLVKAEREKVQEGVLAAYERLVPKEQQQFARPEKGNAGKSPMDVEKEIQELAALWEKNGYDKAQIAERLQKLGLSAPQGKSAAEYAREKEAAEKDGKFTESEGKAEAASDAVKHFAEQAGLVRDTKTNKWVPGEGVLPPAVGEGVKGFFGGATPVHDALEAAVEAYGRYQSGGVIGPDERKNFRKLLGADTTTRAQLAEKLNAAENTIQARRPRVKREDPRAAPESWR